MAPNGKDETPGSILDRFKHPVLGPFISAWLIWNWQIFFLVIHSMENPKDSINEINVQYLVGSRLFSLLWGPLLSAIAFVVLGPIFHNLYLSWNTLVEKGRTWIDLRVDEVQAVPKSKLIATEIQLNDAQRSIRMYDQVMMGIADAEKMIIDSNGQRHFIRDLWVGLKSKEREVEGLQKAMEKLQNEYNLLKLKNK